MFRLDDGKIYQKKIVPMVHCDPLVRALLPQFWICSSMAEHSAVNREVVGSLRKLGVASVTSHGCLLPVPGTII